MRLKSVCLILALSLFVSVASAEEVCFSDPDAKAIVVELEKGRNLKEQVELYKKANTELEQQVKLMKEISALQKEQIAVGDKAIKQYQDIITYQGNAYEQVIKESKPNPLKQFMDSVGLIGIGILAGFLLL